MIRIAGDPESLNNCFISKDLKGFDVVDDRVKWRTEKVRFIEQ